MLFVRTVHIEGMIEQRKSLLAMRNLLVIGMTLWVAGELFRVSEALKGKFLLSPG